MTAALSVTVRLSTGKTSVRGRRFQGWSWSGHAPLCLQRPLLNRKPEYDAPSELDRLLRLAAEQGPGRRAPLAASTAASPGAAPNAARLPRQLSPTAPREHPGMSKPHPAPSHRSALSLSRDAALVLRMAK